MNSPGSALPLPIALSGLAVFGTRLGIKISHQLSPLSKAIQASF
jgi:hypothetical protein